MKLPVNVGAGNSTVSNSLVPFKTQLTIMRMHATTVVMSAPTAMGQKSLGVPAHVRGVRMTATTTIHWHRCRCRPARKYIETVASEVAGHK